VDGSPLLGYLHVMVTPRAGTPKRARRKKRFFLSWCTTEDGDEDWFVVADSARAARRYHERAEGYERGDATAERIAALPAELVRDGAWIDPEGEETCAHPGWPSDALLRACGGDVAKLSREQLRESMGVVCTVVRFGARVYRPGDVVANTRARRGESEPPRLAVFTGGK
jgi:hypothetical protein